MTKSKRLKLTIGILIANYLVYLYGLYQGADPSAIGAGLALLNAPAYGYIWGETHRPSKDDN